MFGDCRFYHLGTYEIARELRQYVTLHSACFVAHTTGEPAQAEAETCPVEVVGHRTRKHGFEFAHPRVLAPLKSRSANVSARN